MNNFEKFRKELPEEERPKKTPVTASNSKPASASQQPLPFESNGDVGKFLSSLLHVTVFFNLFEYIASRLYEGKFLSIKVMKLKSAHIRWFGTCIWLDLVVRFIVTAILISASGYSLYKILVK